MNSDFGLVTVEERCNGGGFSIPAPPTDVAAEIERVRGCAFELLLVCERINALRSPEAENSIGDALGGLGDWLEDVIAKARA